MTTCQLSYASTPDVVKSGTGRINVGAGTQRIYATSPGTVSVKAGRVSLIAIETSDSTANNRPLIPNLKSASNRAAIALLKRYRKRIAELKAAAEDEGIPFSENSEMLVKTFVLRSPKARIPAITLNEMGDLRAIWRSPEGEQVALLFRGRDDVQFVFFAHDKSGKIERASGVTAVDSVIRKINGFGLDRLIQEY